MTQSPDPGAARTLELERRVAVLEEKLADRPWESKEPWLTKRELAARLKVSTATIERHLRPTCVVGGQNRYLVSDALRQLEARAQPPSA